MTGDHITQYLAQPPGALNARPTEEERTWRKQRLAGALRIFGRLGFDEGVAGHVTARDPGNPELFWVNPFGRSFKLMSVRDLILVDADGAVVEGNGMLNRAAFAIHSQIHAARPDVVAAAHAHSVYGKAFSSLHRVLRPLTQDACAFYDDHILFEDYTGVVDDPSEGRRIASALGTRKAAILANHGLLTVGRTVDEALFWFVTMERTCQAELLAMAAGEPVSIGHDVALHTRGQVGTHGAGAFGAQPLYDWICATEPDHLT